MENKKFAFVILHYYTIDDTINCVNSIKKLENYENIEIVIVDNASLNGSGKEIKEKYKNDEKIHVILSDENLGFARGNNLGFVYAKNELKADFIVMCNNDVYMLQDDFCKKIVQEYNESNFAILGPRILLNNNKVCDYNDEFPDIKKFKKQRDINKIYYFFNKIQLRYVFAIFYRIIKCISKIWVKEKLVDTTIRKENVVIQGACIIFSKVYIDKFDGLDDRTFLYYEEQLLYLRVIKNNMKSVYNPYIMIFHNEGVATKKSTKNKRRRVDFQLKHEIDSLNILIKELEGKNK